MSAAYWDSVTSKINVTVSETLDLNFLINAGGERTTKMKISIGPEDIPALLEAAAAVLRKEALQPSVT